MLNIFRVFFSLSAILTLSACVTSEQFEETLNSWVGHSEQTLIEAWGPPSSYYQSGSMKYLTYSNQGSITLPGTQPTYRSTVIGNQIYTNAYGGSAPTTINLSCQKTFTIKNDFVTSWSYKGNGCY
jgi:hypothetical protein